MSQITASKTLDAGQTFAFDAIPSPGAYVCNWSGHLLRIPAEALTRAGQPTVNIIGSNPLTVTKLSNDPFIPLSQAKRAADELHLTVAF